MPGSPVHLTRRFFDVLFARPLRETERAAIRSWVTESEAELFFAQSEPDQRHGYTAGLSIVAEGIEDPDAVRAALLHDIGKRHAGLGVIGRVVASLLILVRLPLRGRFKAYRDHGELGARELAKLGAGHLVVDFARHHHGRRPVSIAPATWEALVRADQIPKPGMPPAQG